MDRLVLAKKWVSLMIGRLTRFFASLTLFLVSFIRFEVVCLARLKEKKEKALE